MLSLLAQVEPDLDQVSESGITDVTTEEWVIAAGVFVASLIIAAIARKAIERVLDRAGGPHQIAILGARVAGFLIVTLGFFYALRSVDVAVGPLIGGLGILGIALAFALQEILGNFASGVILQARRPIRIGDQVVSNEYEGQVEDVNFRSVRLRTFDGETVYLPNSMVLQNPVTNWTKTPTRRTSLAVGVAYDTDLDRAQQILIDAVSGLPGIEDSPAPEAYAYEFADSSINFEVRFWHGATILEMWRARDEASRSIKRALDEAGITIPFPQQTLWFGPDNTELTINTNSRPPGSAGS